MVIESLSDYSFELEDQDLPLEEYHSKVYVADELGIPIAALNRMAEASTILVAANGGIAHSSFLLLRLFYRYLSKRYMQASQARRELGKDAFRKAAHAGRIRIIYALGMDLVSRQEVDCEQKSLVKLARLTVSNRIKLLKKLTDIIPDESLSDADLQFILRHPKGCNGRQLQDYLFGKQTGVIYGALRRGIIRGSQSGRFWHIPFDEMVLAISTHRNWVTIHSVVETGLSDHHTLGIHAQEGYLGPTRQHFCGSLAVSRAILPDIETLFETAKTARLQARSFANSAEGYLQESEMSPGMIATELQISHAGVLHLMDNKHIPYKMRKGHRITRSLSFFRFVGRASRGEIPHLKTKTKLRCKELMHEHEKALQRERRRRNKEKS